MKNNWSYLISIGHIIAALLLFFHLWPGADNNSRIVLMILGSVLIFVVFINYRQYNAFYILSEKHFNDLNNLKDTNQKELVKFSRKARYAEIIPMLNSAFSYLDGVYRDINSTEKDYLVAFRDYSTRICQVFSKITGADCCVCIKINNNPPKDAINESNPVFSYYSIDLVRDSLRTDREDCNQSQHPYRNNTDFDKIFKSIKTDEGRYFLCNDLLSLPIYENTSFERYDLPSKAYPPGISREDKERTWPLKYKSTIVAPICPSIAKDRQSEKLLGFICVDSDQINIFEKEDAELLIGCADGIWNILYYYIQKIEGHIQSPDILKNQ